MKENSTKIRAIELRKKGLTFQEISETLKISLPKSTISTWCKGVKLPESYPNKVSHINNENLKKARIKALKTNKENRNKYLEKIKASNLHLKDLLKNIDIAKITLSALYLAEGNKRSGSTNFGNSNPGIIRLYLKLLRFCYKTEESKFRCTLQCRADQNIKKLEKFWSTITKIKPSQFYKAQIDARTIGKKTIKPNYKGVCRIDYFNADIYNELKVIGEMITN